MYKRQDLDEHVVVEVVVQAGRRAPARGRAAHPDVRVREDERGEERARRGKQLLPHEAPHGLAAQLRPALGQARASSAALQESSRVALTPFIDVDDQRDASVKRASFVDVSSIDAIAEFSLSSPQGFFAEGPPSVLRGRGPPSGIFVALIDDARRRFSLSNRAEASARIFALRSWGCLLYTSPSPRD